MSMLPQVFPPPARECPVDVWGLVHPAREVGGDLYDFFTTADGSLCFFVGDVSGKGMPAALFMARTKSLIRIATELMRERQGAAASPADIIARVNRELCQSNNDMMFVTLFFGMLALDTGEVLYCNAGHNPPYRVDGGTPQAIEDAKGMILGIQPRAAYTTGKLVLAPGETLYLYSDGVTEGARHRAQGRVVHDLLLRRLARVQRPRHAALAHHHDPMRHPQDLRQLRRDHDDRLAALRQVVQQPVDLLLGAHVDPPRRLVEDQDVAVLHEPLRDHHLLLIAT